MKKKKTISIIKIYYLKNKFKIFCILLVFLIYVILGQLEDSNDN